MDCYVMNEKLLGKCGFHCGACPTYNENNCKDCIKEHGEGDCFSRDCVIKNNLDFCGKCEKFPCDEIINRAHSTVLDK